MAAIATCLSYCMAKARKKSGKSQTPGRKSGNPKRKFQSLTALRKCYGSQKFLEATKLDVKVRISNAKLWKRIYVETPADVKTAKYLKDNNWAESLVAKENNEEKADMQKDQGSLLLEFEEYDIQVEKF